MKRTSYALAFILSAGIPLSAQQSSGEQGDLIALGGGRVDQRASTRVLYSYRGKAPEEVHYESKEDLYS